MVLSGFSRCQQELNVATLYDLTTRDHIGPQPPNHSQHQTSPYTPALTCAPIPIRTPRLALLASAHLSTAAAQVASIAHAQVPRRALRRHSRLWRRRALLAGRVVYPSRARAQLPGATLHEKLRPQARSRVRVRTQNTPTHGCNVCV